MLTSTAAALDLTTMMQIIVNGETHDVTNGLTAAQLVELFELGGRRLAMEVNGEIVPRSQYEQHAFCQGDRVEIVQAIGGG